MTLVNYASSDSEAHVSPDERAEAARPSKKRRLSRDHSKAESNHAVLPPLPAAFRSMYVANVRTSTVDDPALHGGRTRQVPHVEGNWPAHVYLEWYPSRSELRELQGIVETVVKHTNTKVNSLLQTELGVRLPLHISLSVPLVLPTDRRQDFKDAIGSHVSASNVRPFRVSCGSLAWVANSDKTRHFLVITFKEPANDELDRLLVACNQAAATFGFAQLYEDTLKLDKPGEFRAGVKGKSRADSSPRFHVSIGWRLAAPSESDRTMIETSDMKQRVLMPIYFHTIKIKIGSDVEDLPLS